MKKETYSLRLRLMRGGVAAMGPGKADLLDGIRRTGSITAAAAEMEMSYRRAWGLIQEMNKAFRAPLVEAETGGARGGGAKLTALGADALDIFRKAERAAARAAAPSLKRLTNQLKG